MREQETVSSANTRFAYIVTNDVQKAIRSNSKKINLLRRNVIRTRVRGQINENRPDGKQLLIHVMVCVCASHDSIKYIRNEIPQRSPAVLWRRGSDHQATLQ